MDEVKGMVGICAILALACIECCLILTGQDGATLVPVVATIALIAGVSIPSNLRSSSPAMGQQQKEK